MKIKRVLAFVLALALVIAIAAPAFAAGPFYCSYCGKSTTTSASLNAKNATSTWRVDSCGYVSGTHTHMNLTLRYWVTCSSCHKGSYAYVYQNDVCSSRA